MVGYGGNGDEFMGSDVCVCVGQNSLGAIGLRKKVEYWIYGYLRNKRGNGWMNVYVIRGIHYEVPLIKWETRHTNVYVTRWILTLWMSTLLGDYWRY